MNLQNRVGRFSVSVGLIEAAVRDQTTETASLNALFGKCIIIEAETRHFQRRIDYSAYCADFDETPSYFEAPWYDIETTRLEDTVGGQKVETYEVKFKRRAQQ